MFLLSLHVSAFVPLVWVKGELCLAFSVFTSEKFIFFATHQLSLGLELRGRVEKGKKGRKTDTKWQLEKHYTQCWGAMKEENKHSLATN